MNIRRIDVRRLLLTGVTVLTLLTQWFVPASAFAMPNSSGAALVATSVWCVAGSFQGWDNASTPLNDNGVDGDLFAGDHIFSAKVTIATAGSYDWKAVTCGDWNTAFPSSNAWFVTSAANQIVTLTFDTNDHSGDAGPALQPAQNIVSGRGDTLPNSYTAVGPFQGWNNADPATMLQSVGNELYRLAYTFASPGTYEAKVTNTGGWTYQFGADGRSADAKTISFTTTAPDQTVILLLDARSGRMIIQPNGSGTGNWCVTGAFQGWNNMSTSLNDNGVNGDLLGGDGVFSLDYSVPATGRYEWKVVACGDWNTAFPSANSWFLTTLDNQTVKFTFDSNDHSVDAGQSLYPMQNIVNVFDSIPSSFNVVGSFQGWNNADPAATLTPLDRGWHMLRYPIATSGSYLGKVTTTGSWDGFGKDGRSIDAQNFSFQTYVPDSNVQFALDVYTGRMTVIAPPPPVQPSHDNNVEWDGLKHDSRDTLYRTPGGAVPAGSTVLIRFRTFHNDVTGVKLRVYDLNASAQSLVPMTIAAADVPCDQVLPYTCDYWQAEVHQAAPNNLWYRFIVTDGTKTVYYADNTSALDGGLGSPSDTVADNSYALMFYDPSFTAPAWAKNASIYQIFPDRFRDGRADNNPKTGDVRYDDPVLKLPWGTLPEGFCRNYSDGSTNCPWRFDTTPPADSPTKEQPRGRDYFGGDLKGVDQNLDYLKALGVNTLYFNPIFDAGSNHGYDTQDYYKIDPYFGTQKDFDNLVKHANQLGMRIVLDGVFNHMSSDSPIFDRYHHYAGDGACESVSSPYRSWFTFHDVPAGTGTCLSSTGAANSATYDGWFGFDSIPVINKSLPAVQQYFVTNKDSVTNHWLTLGSSGWRMDVMGDASFPAGYWETFRGVVKTTKPEALIISETWQKDSTLLRMLRGDRADTTMNYRLRDAVIGLLTPGAFDSKGFADSGRIILPSEFASRMDSIREDYPDAAYYSLMNLLDSHDTERLRWTLTPSQSETKAEKELNTANVAEGKKRQQIASLIQFTVPGAPTVYYGDEVGVTGDDDPDDRRTYPWADKGGTPDPAMFTHYQTLNALRKNNPVLTGGDFEMLLANDLTQVIAYGRKVNNQAAIVIVNRSNQTQTGAIPVAGYLPNGITLTKAYAVGTGSAASVTVTNGAVSGSIGPMSAVIFISGTVDLQPTVAPTGLQVTAEGNGTVSLSWSEVAGSAGYNLYRSYVSGGGWVKLNASPLTGTTFNDTGLQNALTYYYVVTSLDTPGNESKYSNEVNALPHLSIGWANLQWPPTLTHTISTVNRTGNVYGQVWIDGVTNQPGATPTLRAQLGYGPEGTNPDGNSNWLWVDASFNTDAGNNDEFAASLLPDAIGSFDYVYRYSTTGGASWLYADLNGPVAPNALPANPGKLTVNSSGDTTPAAVPLNLLVTSASPTGIALQWDPVTGDSTLYGYEVLRSNTSGGPYALLGTTTANTYSDTAVVEGATYYYVVRSLDYSFNRSANSGEVVATAEPRTVTVVFNVTVPATTDATGRSVYIAGFLDRLDGNLPQWNPGGVVLTRVDATTWTITLTGKEGTQIEYKYALGSWDYVEKDGACGEVANRQLTLSYGATGTQTVNDTVLNWRNVSSCGN